MQIKKMDHLRVESRLSQQHRLEPTPPTSQASHKSGRSEHGFHTSCDKIKKSAFDSFGDDVLETLMKGIKGEFRDGACDKDVKPHLST